MSCILFLSLSVAANLAPQDSATKKVVAEATRLRENNNSPDVSLEKATKEARERTTGLDDALRDWIESRLPKSKGALDADNSALQTHMKAELLRAGVLAPADAEDEYGYIGRLDLSRPSEFPEALTVVAGITVPCGSYDSVYVYDYSGGPPRRVFEARGGSEQDANVSAVYFSKPNTSGNHLLLTLRYAIQCGASWDGLSYDLFRLGTGASAAVPIFSGQHDIWRGTDHPYNVELTPDELSIELLDRSIDPAIHNRTHVLHYKLGPAAVERTDPVALQPPDFVDEWLTRPWAEMESRSSTGDRDKLGKWHNFLSGGFLAGDINIVQSCTEKLEDWKVAVNLSWLAGKQLPEQFTLYFVVHELGKYRFEMAAISFEPPDGCPGESRPKE